MSGIPVNEVDVFIPDAVKSKVLATSFLFALLYLIGTVVVIPASTVKKTLSLWPKPWLLAVETVIWFFSKEPLTVLS